MAARVSGWRATSRVLAPFARRKRMSARSKSRSSRHSSRTLEFLAAVVLRIEVIARSRRSSGRSPAQPASSARISSSVALFVGVSSDGRSGLRAALSAYLEGGRPLLVEHALAAGEADPGWLFVSACQSDGVQPLSMNAVSLMLTRRYHAGGGSLRTFGSHRIRHA